MTNGPWWILLGVAICVLLFNSIRGGVAAYYFKDYLGEDNSLGGNLLLSCGAFLAIGEVANMLGVTLASPVARRIGKKRTYMLALIGSGVLSVVFFHMPLSVAGCWAIVVLQVLISAFAGMTFPLLWSMFADVADYSELKHGHSSTGLIFFLIVNGPKVRRRIWQRPHPFGCWRPTDTIRRPMPCSPGRRSSGLRLLMSYLPAAGCVAGLPAAGLFIH